MEPLRIAPQLSQPFRELRRFDLVTIKKLLLRDCDSVWMQILFRAARCQAPHECSRQPVQFSGEDQFCYKQLAQLRGRALIFYFNRTDLLVKPVRAAAASKVVNEIIKGEAPVRQPCFCFLSSD